MDESNAYKKILTPLQAKRKAESYCAYQERSQQEVRDKLYAWGLHQQDVENVIVELIEDNFLNEERFAKAYASGKFRMKGWGKIKIKQQLKMKQVSEPLIRLALQEIDPNDYAQKLIDIIAKKISKPIADLSYAEKSKLVLYLRSRGFESDLIYEHLQSGRSY